MLLRLLPHDLVLSSWIVVENRTRTKVRGDPKRSPNERRRHHPSLRLSVIGPSFKNEFVDSDDEVDHDVFQPKRGSVTKSGRGNEFDTLAMVDLTTPLGEDDVMPRNEHYVVPERPRVQQFEHPAKMLEGF
eukprot:g13087.t1 g13087   contig7:844440-844832(+)